MNCKQFNSIILITFFFFSAGQIISAGPVIIRDNRIHDIALTPVLGRGYTIATNTFQSRCIKNVVMTSPSYDFTYKFRSISGGSSTSASGTQRARGMAGLDVIVPVAEVPVELGLNIDLSASYTYSGGVKMYYHRILVEINMNSYYASVDEAKSMLSDAAIEMLAASDVAGFFSSCGTYYVRSLGRNARFISVFTYMDTSVEADMSFEAELKAELSAFKIFKGLDVSQGMESSFATKASVKRLTIDTMAFGLGKKKKASLISYDLPTYKAAIRDAFLSMQDKRTGKVSSMEVVPWIENTEFQRQIKLEQVAVDEKSGKAMNLHRKKHNLELNGEFLAEIDRVDRRLLNRYYRAKICRQTIDNNWKKDGKFYPGFKDRLIINHKFPVRQMKLVELDKMLTEDSIIKLLDEEEGFMYGTEGAEACIEKLHKNKFFKKNWRQIGVCTNLRAKFVTATNSTIDDYCMPLLVPVRSKSILKEERKK